MGTKQTHAKPDARQPILFGGSESCVNSIDHAAETSMPGLPMSRIDDDVGITATVLRKALAICVAQFGQALRGRG
ncbi:hypothetical protein D3C76_1020420 [compost metagenome]